MTLADYNDSVPAVQVDGGGAPDAVSVIQAAGQYQNVKGPALVLGQYGANEAGASISPYRQNQAGFWSGNNAQITSRVIGQVDAARRTFGPTAVRFTNLAITNPATWSGGYGSPTVTSGITAPDGTTGAGRVSAAGGAGTAFYRATRTWAAGDYVICGVWARSQTTNGFAGSSPGFCGLTGGTFTISGNGNMFQRLTGDGEWSWYTALVKVLTQSGTSDLAFDGTVDATHTIEFYGPVLYHIPTGTISENEVYEVANSLQSFGTACAVGTFCGLPTQTPQDLAGAFSTLPSCVAGLEGARRAVTDSSTATWGATVTGSSTNHDLAYCDGTNWTVAAK